MRDYFLDARVSATVSITANLGVTLGVGLSLYHREQSEKIRRYEASNEPERFHAVALLKVELAEFERFVASVERLLAVKREEAKEDAGHG